MFWRWVTIEGLMKVFFLFSDNKRRNRPIIVRTTVPHWKSTYSINCIDYCKIRPVPQKKEKIPEKHSKQLEWKKTCFIHKISRKFLMSIFYWKYLNLFWAGSLQYSAESLSQLESFEEYCLFIPLVTFDWKL